MFYRDNKAIKASIYQKTIMNQNSKTDCADAKEYRISDSAVSNILKKSEHWLSIDTILPNANNFREKLSNFLQIEEAINIWVDQQISRSLILNGPIIQEKAK
ncbi:5827_t:CDS:2 [Funneliformis caledonium]|uniref:5827_t:CDS:1 n=1 Tax=Funneliformis caledonium TaxID=1117310 RepID=A0A9N9BE88_9GLOM|nr:5827_t:CDS:2 [Funneliformis caledonium]